MWEALLGSIRGATKRCDIVGGFREKRYICATAIAICESVSYMYDRNVSVEKERSCSQKVMQLEVLNCSLSPMYI